MPAGRDVSVSHLIPYRTDFYSHAREGRDAQTHTLGTCFVFISTHTPARGVTLTNQGKQSILVYFYSHAREGRDVIRP